MREVSDVLVSAMFELKDHPLNHDFFFYILLPP